MIRSLGAMLLATTALQAAACENLVSLTLDHAVISSAELMTEGPFTGGRQAVMSAQRYPADFDGIIAGALVNRTLYQHTSGVVREIQLTRNPDQRIPAATAEMVNEAVMNACDTYGEGFVNNPRQCGFDFSTLACGAGETGDQCLSPGQLQTVEAYYGGLRNSAGELLFPGQAMGNRLTELQGFDESGNPGYGWDTIRYWGFQHEDYDSRDFDLDRDMPIMEERVGFVNSTDPDLREFKANGGKLLLYVGWQDLVAETTAYCHDSVLEEMGPDQAGWMRLFMAPGMGHCGGGPGPNSFDTLGPLDAWVTEDTAPDQLMGTNGQSGLTRPICPYPRYARYDRTGNLADAFNWSCAAP